jgi:release factor glutamine methyltransferase
MLTGMTVLEVIRRSTEFLARKGVESPRLDAELLLAHALKMARLRLYLEFERALTPAEEARLRGLVKRRGQREPLPQITGSSCFCGLEIGVDRHVLAPRPETELLAERGWQFLRELVRRGEATADSPPKALEFGLGSGCLAITLAVNCPEAHVYGVEVSAEALAVARQNAARHGVSARLHLEQGDGFGALPAGLRAHLIVSNPPYIPSGELASLAPEVRDYEPRQALDGGLDGLVYYRRLAVEAPPFLGPGGRLMVELGDGQAEALRDIFGSQNWIVETVQEDYTQRARVLVARRSMVMATGPAGQAAGNVEHVSA